MNDITDPGYASDQHRIAKSKDRIAALEAQLAAAKEEVEKLKKDQAEWREFHTMQLAAISTASFQNTEASKRDRIGKDHPYASTAYFDVCRAIDREMALRASLADLSKVAEAMENAVRNGHFGGCFGYQALWDATTAFADWKKRNP